MKSEATRQPASRGCSGNKADDFVLDCVRVTAAMEVGASGTTDIVVSPAGRVQSTKGAFVMDEVGWREIEKSFARRGIELAVDYEHQTLPELNTRTDGLAPRAGSIKALRFDPQVGLVATIDWTQKAREMIRAGEYKYPSPVVAIRKTDQRAVELISVGLTNDPAIFGIGALAASRFYREAHSMDAAQGATAVSDPAVLIGEMAGFLGITTDGKDVAALMTEIRDAIGKKKAEKAKDEGDKKVASSVRKGLGLSADAGEEAVTLALKNVQTEKSSLGAVQTELAAMKAKLLDQEWESFIAPHKAKGVVSDANKDDLAMLQRVFKANRGDCELILSARKGPKQEQITDGATSKEGAGDRTTVIANARTKFREDLTIGKVTSLRAFTNQTLADAEKELLTDAEIKTLAA